LSAYCIIGLYTVTPAPGAQQRRGAVQRQALWDPDDEVLADDDHVGEASLGGRTVVVVVDAVGGEHELGAVVLVPRAAALAGAAGVDEVARAHCVPGLELGDAMADVCDDAHNLMPASLTCTSLDD
jgi:hypothetical protein